MELARLRNLAGLVAAALLMTASASAQKPAPVAPNDNRTPAGTLRDGVLHLEFNIDKGSWYPESDDGESVPVYAFGEAGKPLQTPGPTIRVPQGTTIDISLHNALTVPVTLHGFYERPGSDSDTATVGPDETKHLRFAAGAAGTYPYYGRTPDGGMAPNGRNRVLDALLGGAFVVDPPGADPTQDRILVLERWKGALRTAINGKSWPFTERLNAEVGKPVHWKVLNVSDLSHPMHLHGFHFWLDAEGDGESYHVLGPNERHEEFTHSVDVMKTFELTWIPKEPGRWLYHCHRMAHMRLPLPLQPGDGDIPEHVPEHDHMEAYDSGYAGLGGMILGITVTGPSEFDTVHNWKPERRVKLDITNREDDPSLYEIALTDLNSNAKPTKSTGLTGPLLVVTKGQKTEITVVNEASTATSVHWHGQEIESYYDGVPWWDGIGDKRAPLLDPGQEFTAKLIPQRAGSFIYHAHWHDGGQLMGGLQGPMIVLEPGETYDPEKDKYFIMSSAPAGWFGGAMLLMNGLPQPTRTMRLHVGETYRFRFMNITPVGDDLHVGLMGASGPVQWEPLDKDAAETVTHAPQEADQHVAVGETFDFEYRATKAEELHLQAWYPGSNPLIVQTMTFTDR
jgi:FtsP/CotA-like multicopper oxidase with cupredoxin domain